MKKNKHPFGKILLILTIVFFYLPIMYMIIFSFNDGKSLTKFTGFSLRWYQHMMDSGDMMSALSTTFKRGNHRNNHFNNYRNNHGNRIKQIQKDYQKI